MIKVLHIYDDLKVAGAQTVIMNYLRSFSKDTAIEMTLLVNGIPVGTAYEEECEENCYSVIYSGYKPSNGIKGLRTLVNWLKLQFYIYRTIYRQKPDIIHTHITSSLPFVTIPVLLSHPKMWVHTLHSDPYVFSKFVALWARIVFHLSNVYPICVTKGQAQKALARYGIKQYSIIRNGIDVKQFTNIDRLIVRQELGISENSTVIGCVGRFDQIKNHSFLVHLFAEYAKRNTDSTLLLVGDGPERQNIHKLGTELGISEKILFTGVRSDAVRMYFAMDLFMLTSFFESSSIVTVEAQIAGLKCVIADSIPEDVVVTEKVNRVPLSAPLSTWIAAMNDELPHDAPKGTINDFSNEENIKKLKSLYMSLI